MVLGVRGLTVLNRLGFAETAVISEHQIAVSVEQAAEIVRVSRSYMYALARYGAVRTLRIGRLLRIPMGDVDSLRREIARWRKYNG